MFQAPVAEGSFFNRCSVERDSHVTASLRQATGGLLTMAQLYTTLQKKTNPVTKTQVPSLVQLLIRMGGEKKPNTCSSLQDMARETGAALRRCIRIHKSLQINKWELKTQYRPHLTGYFSQLFPYPGSVFLSTWFPKF